MRTLKDFQMISVSVAALDPDRANDKKSTRQIRPALKLANILDNHLRPESTHPRLQYIRLRQATHI